MTSRLLLIHTGGTLGMAPSGDPVFLAPGPSLERVFQLAPELGQLAEFTFLAPFNLDSTSLEPEHILELAALIRAHAPGHKGVVVIHGTDTMAFTASVLGFLLADLGLPVVLTGSQRPLAYARSDARGNLVDAVSVALSGVAEVGICFGDHWLRGVAADKVSIHRYEAFESPDLPPLAELGLHIHIHPHAGAFKRAVPAGLGRVLETRIETYTPFPGMPWRLPAEDTRALLIQAYGAGNLPLGRPDLETLLAHCQARALPVVITSQCLSGGVDLAIYELGRKALAQGCISGGHHTRWAALAKLGLCLGAGLEIEAVRAAFSASWAGEPI